MSKEATNHEFPVCCGTSASSFDPLSVKLCLFKQTRDPRRFAGFLDETFVEVAAYSEYLCAEYPLSAEDAAKLRNDSAMKLLRAVPWLDCRHPHMPYYNRIVERCAIDHARYEWR